MTVLVDTNVVVDALLLRGEFAQPALRVFDRIEKTGLHALLCATTVTTIDYLARRQLGRDGSRGVVGQLLTLFDVAPVNRGVLEQALASAMADFEDAVLAHAAQACGAMAIVTRNLRDFAGSPVRAYTPEQWLALQDA